ncbi:helicase HerA-like domain-containing protein [Stetteria hydrogenophila]
MLVVTSILGAASMALMVRNMLSSRESVGGSRIEFAEENPPVAVIDGRRVIPVAYTTVDYTSRSVRSSGESLVKLARSMGLSVTFISSHLRLRKDKLLREIEREMQKAEMAYSSTRMIKYRERLKFLEGLYAELSRVHIPYASSFSFIVWLPAGNPDALSEAEAFKAIVEAELGVRLKRVELKSFSDLVELLAHKALPGPESMAPLPPPERPVSPSGILLGRKAGDPSKVVAAEWPRDLEAHGTVIGPTGRGKTVLLAGIAAQLALRFGVNVTVVDPKGDLARLLASVADAVLKRSGDSLGEGLVVYSLAEAPQAEKGSLAASLLAKALESAYREPKSRVVIIDEAWRVLNTDPEPLEAAVREGRSLGLHVVYAVQTPHDIPATVLENTRFYAVFGGPGREYAEDVKAIGLESVAGKLPSMSVGEAIVKTASGIEHALLFDFSKYLYNP